MKIPFKGLKKAVDSSCVSTGSTFTKNVSLDVIKIEGVEYFRVTSTTGSVLSRQLIKIEEDLSFPAVDSCYPKSSSKITLTIVGDKVIALNKWLEGVQKGLKNSNYVAWNNSVSKRIKVQISEDLTQVQFSNEVLLSAVAIPLEESERLILSTMSETSQFYVNLEDLKAGIEAVADLPNRGNKNHIVPAIFMDVHMSASDPIVLKTFRNRDTKDQTHAVIARRTFE